MRKGKADLVNGYAKGIPLGMVKVSINLTACYQFFA